MPQRAKRRYEAVIRTALGQPAALDAALDLYADGLLRATEWDADHWGLPTEDMQASLDALAFIAEAHGCPLWPREAV